MEEHQATPASVQADTAPDSASGDFSSALQEAEKSYGSERVSEDSASVEAVKPAEPNSSGKPKDTGSNGSRESSREGRRSNNANAQRRINASNQMLRNKISDLETEIEKLKKDGSPASYLEQRNLERQRDTYQDIVSSADAESFTDHANETFGESAPEFIQDTYKWSPHVNANEPELRSYISRPYGMVMLREWYKRMKVPSLMQEWLGMTSYEKGRILDGFYAQMLEIARKIGQEQHGGGAKPAPREDMPNIPAVSGGRDANVAGASDDFGIALQSAYNRFGIKR